MIPRHMWLPSGHRTQDSTCIVSSVHKCDTRCTRQNVELHVPIRQVDARMYNVVEVAEIGVGGFINESPTHFTPHNRPNVS